MMVYSESNQKSSFKSLYNDLNLYGESSFDYKGYRVHVEYGVPESVSFYSSAIVKNNYEGTECTIFIGKPCIEDEGYGVALICHEIGHMINGDMNPNVTKHLEDDRSNNLYAKEEYLAWKYAAMQLGVKNVIKAIQKLAVYSLHNHPDSPYPAVELINYAKLLEEEFNTQNTYKTNAIA